MRKKVRKKEVDQKLLDAIYIAQSEWKRVETIVADSIEPMDRSIYKEKLAKAKYLFLLRNAKTRQLNALLHR